MKTNAQLLPDRSGCICSRALPLLTLLFASVGPLCAQNSCFTDQVLSPGQHVQGLTVATNGNVYYADFFGNTLGLLNVQAGTLTPLLTGLNHPWAIEAVGDKIYFTETGTDSGLYHDGSLSVFDIAMATRTVIQSGLHYPKSIFVDQAGNIFVIEDAGSSTVFGGNSRLIRFPPGTNAYNVVIPFLSTPAAVVVNSQATILIGSYGATIPGDSGSLQAYAPGNPNPTTVVSNLPAVEDMAIDRNDNIYLAGFGTDGGSETAIAVVPSGSNGFIPLKSALNAWCLALDPRGDIYYSTGRSLNSIRLLSSSCLNDPAIVAQSIGQFIFIGDSASFNVAASGTPPLSYQWFFNAQNISGAMSSTLTLTNVQLTNAGAYRVVVTNAFGSVASTVLQLAVVEPGAPAVSAFVSSGNNPAYIGSSVTFCASATGAPRPVLQWQFNGTNLPGATNECLTLLNLQTNQSGDYTVIASNSAGVATSSVLSFSVVPPPPVQIFYSYGSPPYEAGSYVSLYSSITLTPPYALQWRFNGSDLLGENRNYLSIRSATPGHVGAYTLLASNSSGAYTSSPLALTIYFLPPVFYNFTFSQGGADALFQNDVTLCGNFMRSLLDYQWRFNGTNLPGQTNACLTLLRISNSLAGAYSIVASNPAGVAISAVQTITVRTQPPIFALQPYNLSSVEGADVRFATFANAGPPASHVLQFNGTNTGVPLTYETNLTGFPASVTGGFTLLDVTPADAGSYRVIASNMFGRATSQVANLTIRSAAALDRWTQRNPLPQSQLIYSVCHSPNQFVAVGDHGTIMTSPNGTNWAVQSRRVDLPLQGVTYGAGLFVAVGEGGTVLSSSDGRNWAYRSSNPLAVFHAVAYGNGRFVTIADTTTQRFLLSSTTGVLWEKFPLPDYLAERGIAYGNGMFVAAGRDAIMTSSNGLDWSVPLSAPFIEFECVAFLNNQFVVAGDDGVMLVSSNGISWTSRATGTTRPLLGVTYGNGKYLAVGARGTIIGSADTASWTPQISGTPDRFETIDFAAGQFVALGENGTTVTSTNGTAWTKQNFGPTRDLDGMAVANGMIVTVGKGGTILTSTNGTNYIARDAGVTNDLHGVGWGNGLWVAVGEPGVILTSTNAVHWINRPSGTTNSLKSAKWVNERWIVVGTEGTIVTSGDGLDWTVTFTSPGYDLNDVAFGNGLYLIAGDGPSDKFGSLFLSSNAVTWTPSNRGCGGTCFGKNLRGITFAYGTFLIAANDGLIVTTSNGVDFTNRFVGGGNLRAATWSHGVWIVVGNGGRIFTSANLQNWTQRPSRIFENLHQVVYLNGQLVTIGNRGTILQSARFVTELDMPAVLPGVGFRLPFRGVINGTYQVQATTNLVNWNTIAIFTNLTERSSYTDSNLLQHRLRFYRLVEP